MHDRKILIISLSLSFAIHFGIIGTHLLNLDAPIDTLRVDNVIQLKFFSRDSNGSIKNHRPNQGKPIGFISNKDTRPIFDTPRQNEVSDHIVKTNIYYFTQTEVTIPASPVGEWVIDWSVWPNEEARSIKFRLWVNERGLIIDWALFDDQLNQDLMKSALATINQTPMNPAILNGSPVPSVQNIELEFSPD